MVIDSDKHKLPALACSATDIVSSVLQRDRRVLLYGPPGVGKSTLAANLGRIIASSGRNCWCLGADPGSPAFGVPGAISLGKWQDDDWQRLESVALCSLDAGRFRTPLITASRRLASQTFDGVLLIDGPGVVRGVAGRELLSSLVEVTDADLVLALTAVDRLPPLLDELCSLPVESYLVHAASEAMRPGKRVRDRRRTQQWETYLGQAVSQQFELANLNIIGTPPPVATSAAWTGRQVALLQEQQTLLMGEVERFDGRQLTLVLPRHVSHADTLLVRDVQRDSDGMLVTAQAFAAERVAYLPPSDVLPAYTETSGPRIVARVGAVDLNLINGVLGDPLLHARIRHQHRSLLFDLGDGGRLSARLAHQVTDVFISHAHLDHIGGFLWLLRSRLGDFPACRLYGPAGLAMHLYGFLQAILWDRIGECGPKFEVMEVHEDYIESYALQAGHSEAHLLMRSPLVNGILLDEPGFKVRTTLLDHQGTTVLAFALEPDKQINVRKDRLQAFGLKPGPWLGELKQALLKERLTALIQLPDGRRQAAGVLADELLLIRPGKKLAYATDLADTPANREHLVKLAQSAHTFFCEAAFSAADAELAARHGHLTTRACGEIAETARVARLIPFHFSRRYSNELPQRYEEIQAVCNKVLIPTSTTVVEANNGYSGSK